MSLLSARDQRSNIIRLTLAQALAGANAAVVYATGAIIGNMLAPDSNLVTVPISIFVIGMAVCILPMGMMARRFGRRATFLAGAGCGVLVGLLGAQAIFVGSFWLFCLATFFGGAYAAVVLSFRFAAADGVEPSLRPRALSFVMGGGIAAGVFGPQLVTYTMDLWPPYLFAATYLVQAAVAAVSAIVLFGVRLPRVDIQRVSAGRPLGTIIRQPRFVTAVICGTVSYTLMNFLMTSAPLAMQMCGHPIEAANLGMQWHIIAMYAPSFFTGRLITRFGSGNVVAVGLALIGLSAFIGLMGVEVAHFWLSLSLLGLGWNFSFIGASAQVLECHRPEEATRVQSFNDFLIFSTMAAGSFASGSLLATYDWDTVLWVSFAPLLIGFAALAFTAVTQTSVATERQR